MNKFKQILGYLWMLMAVVLVIFMISQAYIKVSHAAEAVRTNTLLQWIIILFVFIPICIGLFVFGRYASKGEYDLLPTDSNSLL